MREKGCGHPQHASCLGRLPQIQEFLTQESPGLIDGHKEGQSISKKKEKKKKMRAA